MGLRFELVLRPRKGSWLRLRMRIANFTLKIWPGCYLWSNPGRVLNRITTW
jgi:hypothetical protein